MQIFQDVDPLELTGFMRGLTYNYRGPGTLEQFLPEVHREAMELTFPKATRVISEVARYRTYDTEAPISGRPGFSRVTYSVPPLAEKMLLTEEDRLRLEAAKFGVQQEMLDQIFSDAEILAKKVYARWEYARGQVLQTGKLTAVSTETSRGLVGDIIDYTGLGSIGTATASPLWSDTVNATPLADIRSWMNTYRTNNDNQMPAVGLCSQSVLDALALTDDVKNALTPAGATVPSIAVRPGAADQLLGAFGLPPLRLYNTVVDVAGVSTAVLATNKILFLPAPSTEGFGETMIGLTAEGMDLAKQYAKPLSVGVGLTGLAYVEFDPHHTWTKVAAMGAPVLKDPAKVFLATVL